MINGINHITIAVKSIDEAFEFYKDVLRLTPIMKSNTSAYFKAGDIWIALVEDINFMESITYSHISFSINKPDFPYFEALVRNGIVETWQENKTEGESIYLLDNSGNKLEIHYSTLENRIRQGMDQWGDNITWFV